MEIKLKEFINPLAELFNQTLDIQKRAGILACMDLITKTYWDKVAQDAGTNAQMLDKIIASLQADVDAKNNQKETK